MRDWFGRPVPCQPALSPHSGLYWCLLTGFLPFSATASTHTVNRRWASPELIGSRNCVPMAFTAESPLAQGPVVLEAVRVTGAAFSGFTLDHFFMRLSFSHTQSWYAVDMCVIQKASEWVGENPNERARKDEDTPFASRTTAPPTSRSLIINLINLVTFFLSSVLHALSCQKLDACRPTTIGRLQHAT